MIRRPPRSTPLYSSAASDVYKRQDYTLNDYHQPSDEYSDDWDMTGIEQTIDTIFNVSLNLANSDMWPNWYEDNEFRSIRDKQRE